ncbi:DUF3460 family protein [Undibacterium squillarum]
MKFLHQVSMYESEATAFLKDLKKAKPHLDQEQVAGRSLLWDKAPLDLDQQERFAEARIAQQAYVYQNKG